MIYCNLMFVHVYNKESTALQNCIGKKKKTLFQTKFKPHQKLTEHKMCLAICIVTKPRMQGVDVCTDTVK